MITLHDIKTVVQEIYSSINSTCEDISFFLKGKHFGDMIDETLQNYMIQYTTEFLNKKYTFFDIKVTNITTLEDVDNQSVILNVSFGEQSIRMVIK